MKTLLQKTLSWLNDIETLLCEWLLAAFVVLLFAQILFRQFFNYSIPWSEELSTYMFVWFAYLGAVVAAKMSAHNRVTVHMQWLPRWLSKAYRNRADDPVFAHLRLRQPHACRHARYRAGEHRLADRQRWQ
jgi:TRAP-type C4-dicarboxylate transport system permease small subunit